MAKYTDYATLNRRFVESIAYTRAMEEARRSYGFPADMPEDAAFAAAIAEIIAGYGQPPFLNVMSFGAVGNGVADDTNAFRSALIAAGARGVVVPNGTYNLATWTTFSPGATKALIYGESRDGVKLVGPSGVKFLTAGSGGAEVRNLWFDTWDYGVAIDMTADVGGIVVRDVRFSNITSSCVGIPTGNASSILTGVAIERCYARTVGRFASLNGAIVKNPKVLHNDVEGVTDSFGVIIGNDTYKLNEKILVQGNRLVNIGKASVNGEAHGVIVYGFDAKILDNHVENIWNSDTSTTGAEGIYTKCRRAIVKGNTLVDAVGGDGVTHNGGGEAAINLKGGDLGGSTPLGYGTLVTNNHIECSTSLTLQSPTLDNSGWGVYAHVSNTRVAHNLIANCPGGVRTGGATRNLAIDDNEIYNVTNRYGIDVRTPSDAAQVSVSNNIIDGYGSAAANAANGIFIRSEAGTLQGVSVRGNQVTGAFAAAATRRALQFTSTGPIDQIEITGNSFYDATEAVVFTATTAITNVVLGPNNFRNITNTDPITAWSSVTGSRRSGMNLGHSQEIFSSVNGGEWVKGENSELLTLSLVGVNTDTVGNILPANSIIEAVVARVTTTILTSTDWKISDATTAGRFAAANATMTAGATSIGTVHADQTGAAGPRQAAAAKVRITTTGIATAGAIRITVFYRQFVAPTS